MSLYPQDRRNLAAVALAPHLWRACVDAAGHGCQDWRDLTSDEHLMWAQRALVVIDFFPESQADPAKAEDDRYFDLAAKLARETFHVVKA